MHGDRHVYSVPRFQPGIDSFIRHPSHNGKMPLYRASCTCSQIHRDTAVSMAQVQRTQTRHANATHTTPRAVRTREHPRAKSSVPIARSGPPSSPRPKAPRTHRLQALNQRKHKKPPRTADTPRHARNHPTHEPQPAPRAKPGHTAQVPSAKPPHPSFFGIAKRRTSSR